MLATNESWSQNLKPGVRWTVDGASSWNVDGNWAIAGTDPPATGVPGEGEVASILNGGTAQVTGAVPNVDALSVRDGRAEINQGGSLTVGDATVVGGGGTLSLAGNGSLTTGSLSNSGNLAISGKDAKLNVGGDFHSPGILTLNTSGSDPYAITNVGGHANLSHGAIDLASTPAGAEFSFGSSWPFLKAASVSGQPGITVGGAAPNLPRGLGLQVATAGDGTASVAVSSVPILVIDRLTGQTSLDNVAGGTLDIQAYAINSESGLLSRRNWNSLQDKGIAGWDEASPSETQLPEYNLAGSLALNVGDSIDLGAAFTGIGKPPRQEDVTFSYLLADGRVLDGPVEYLGPPNDLVLNVNPDSGAATLQNFSSLIGDVDLASYAVLSESGSLVIAGFTGLGDGWVNANPQTTALAELNLTGSKVFGEGTTAEIGNIFDLGGAQDLVLQYSTTEGFLRFGTVEYGTGAIVPTCQPINALLGDLDGDGTVAFADFLSLSANFGQQVSSYGAGDVDCDGSVAFADFLALSANFGRSLGATAAAVPEPATGFLALCSFCGLLAAGRRPRTFASVFGCLMALTFLATSPQAWAVDFDTRFIRLHPEGPNNQINTAIEAKGILDGTVHDIIKNEDLTGKLDLVDLAGGLGNFTVDNPYLNGVDNETMDDFLQQVTGVLEIPAGDWSIGFGSDDGGYINMSNVTFISTFGENGAGPVGDGEIIFNATRGHAWTAGTFTAPAGGLVTNFEAAFYERGGGDSFEVAVLDGFAVNQDEVRDFGFELEDESFGWKVLSQAPTAPIVGDFNGDGVVELADEGILDRNFGTGTTLAQGDINGDGVVDLHDVGQFARVFVPAPVAAEGVPEPASLSLVLFGAAALSGLLRRRVRR